MYCNLFRYYQLSRMNGFYVMRFLFWLSLDTQLNIQYCTFDNNDSILCFYIFLHFEIYSVIINYDWLSKYHYYNIIIIFMLLFHFILLHKLQYISNFLISLLSSKNKCHQINMTKKIQKCMQIYKLCYFGICWYYHK